MLIAERSTRDVRALHRADHHMVVWWSTETECVSAIARHEHAGLEARSVDEAFDRLDQLVATWQEIQPGRAVRSTARRLLRTHLLRAADALQLAAAVEAAEGQPASLPFVSLDTRLIEAARREGFDVDEL